MFRKVSQYIKENNLIEDGDRIVVGVSGGADSVCLLHLLHGLYREKPVELIVVHINHGIRGKDADMDEQFVRKLSESIGTGYYGFHFEVKEKAAKEGLSEEEAGREVRYQAFLEICERHGCNKIAIAHNKNDNAETVLFHLFRGSGMKGLSGIDPIRTVETAKGKVSIIRPLLFTSREEIEAYLQEKNYIYRTDMTNWSDAYSRNKLRNRVLSYVTSEINKNAVSHVTEAASSISEAERYIGKQVSICLTRIVKREDSARCFKVEELRKEDIVIQKGIIMKILEELSGSRKDLELIHVQAVLSLYDKQVGKLVNLPYGICAVRKYHSICLSCDNMMDEYDRIEPSESVRINIPGKTYLKNNKRILETEIIKYEKSKSFPKNSCTKWFDYDKIENTVELRTRREGDYLQINAQGGCKKLKDYLIDVKIPVRERDFLSLIADGSHIMWILGTGERMSEKYKVLDDTQNILVMNIIDAEEDEDVK